MLQAFIDFIEKRPDDGLVCNETCSEHLLTGLLRRLNDGHENTVKCSEYLMTVFVRRSYNGNVSTEIFSEN
jgi:hypothetical protein